MLWNMISFVLVHNVLVMRMSRRGVVFIASGFAMANIGNTLWPTTPRIQLILAIVINVLLVIVGAFVWGLITLRTAKVLAKADSALGAILSDVEAQQTHQLNNH